MTKREFLDTVFALAPNEANKIMDAFDEYAENNVPHWIPVAENCDCDKMDKCEKLQLPPASCSEFPNNSDTISRQAAIDALKNDMASLDHIIKGMSAMDVRLDAYVSQRNQVVYDIYAIKQLPPIQPEPHWIPVTERLPKEDGNYLVSGKWGSGKESVGDCEFSVEDGYFQTAWNFDVLAWRELPEPYKGVTE